MINTKLPNPDYEMIYDIVTFLKGESEETAFVAKKIEAKIKNNALNIGELEPLYDKVVVAYNRVMFAQKVGNIVLKCENLSNKIADINKNAKTSSMQVSLGNVFTLLNNYETVNKPKLDFKSLIKNETFNLFYTNHELFTIKENGKSFSKSKQYNVINNLFTSIDNIYEYYRQKDENKVFTLSKAHNSILEGIRDKVAMVKNMPAIDFSTLVAQTDVLNKSLGNSTLLDFDRFSGKTIKSDLDNIILSEDAVKDLSAQIKKDYEAVIKLVEDKKFAKVCKSNCFDVNFASSNENIIDINSNKIYIPSSFVKTNTNASEHEKNLDNLKNDLLILTNTLYSYNLANILKQDHGVNFNDEIHNYIADDSSLKNDALVIKDGLDKKIAYGLEYSQEELEDVQQLIALTKTLFMSKYVLSKDVYSAVEKELTKTITEKFVKITSVTENIADYYCQKLVEIKDGIVKNEYINNETAYNDVMKVYGLAIKYIGQIKKESMDSYDSRMLNIESLAYVLENKNFDIDNKLDVFLSTIKKFPKINAKPVHNLIKNNIEVFYALDRYVRGINEIREPLIEYTNQDISLKGKNIFEVSQIIEESKDFAFFDKNTSAYRYALPLQKSGAQKVGQYTQLTIDGTKKMGLINELIREKDYATIVNLVEDETLFNGIDKSFDFIKNISKKANIDSDISKETILNTETAVKLASKVSELLEATSSKICEKSICATDEEIDSIGQDVVEINTNISALNLFVESFAFDINKIQTIENAKQRCKGSISNTLSKGLKASCSGKYLTKPSLVFKDYQKDFTDEEIAKLLPAVNQFTSQYTTNDSEMRIPLNSTVSSIISNISSAIVERIATMSNEGKAFIITESAKTAQGLGQYDNLKTVVKTVIKNFVSRYAKTDITEEQANKFFFDKVIISIAKDTSNGLPIEKKSKLEKCTQSEFKQFKDALLNYVAQAQIVINKDFIDKDVLEKVNEQEKVEQKENNKQQIVDHATEKII